MSLATINQHCLNIDVEIGWLSVWAGAQVSLRECPELVLLLLEGETLADLRRLTPEQVRAVCVCVCVCVLVQCSAVWCALFSCLNRRLMARTGWPRSTMKRCSDTQESSLSCADRRLMARTGWPRLLVRQTPDIRPANPSRVWSRCLQRRTMWMWRVTVPLVPQTADVRPAHGSEYGGVTADAGAADGRYTASTSE